MQLNPTLHTQRFTLTPISDSPESNGHLIEMMQDDAVQRYVRGHAFTDKEVLEGLERFHRLNNANGQGYWLIWDERQVCAGMCLLKAMPTAERTDHIETGYWLKPEFWGQGIAGEVATRMVQYAFEELGLAKVTEVVDEENIGSIKSLERAGLTRRGKIVAYEQLLPFYQIDNPNSSD